MDHNDKIKTARQFDASAVNDELRSDEEGKMGIMKQIGFVPDYSTLVGKTESEILEVVEGILKEQLWKACQELGYWPDEDRKSYEIYKQEDGSFRLVAFLSSTNKLSHPDIKDIISINND